MRILVIEDEIKIANSIKRGLEQEAYSVDISNDGLEGYDLASEEEYDLLVLDLMLPNMSGIEICAGLRESKKHLPILMLTAKSDLEDKVAGLNTGADDYLTKPFAFEELLARVKALLRRPKVTLSHELICGDLVLNTDTLNVKRGDSDIILSKTEFSLLEYLLRNKDRTVNKEQIISHVWSYDADILPNTVEQYIGYLRSKIDKAFPKKPKLIYTVRGFGYKISEKYV